MTAHNRTHFHEHVHKSARNMAAPVCRSPQPSNLIKCKMLLRLMELLGERPSNTSRRRCRRCCRRTITAITANVSGQSCQPPEQPARHRSMIEICLGCPHIYTHTVGAMMMAADAAARLIAARMITMVRCQPARMSNELQALSRMPFTYGFAECSRVF